MKDYKDRTIKKLMKIIDRVDDAGDLLDEEVQAYDKAIEEYLDGREEELLALTKKEPYESYSNCVILRDTEDGEITVKAYSDDQAGKMMYDVSRAICFSDCDDTYEIIKIVYRGREVEYNGWMPGMVMSYSFKETGDEAWSGCFPQWDH